MRVVVRPGNCLQEMALLNTVSTHNLEEGPLCLLSCVKRSSGGPTPLCLSVGTLFPGSDMCNSELKWSMSAAKDANWGPSSRCSGDFLAAGWLILVFAGDSRLARAREGERATLESCLESCLVEEAEAFLEGLWDSNVFSIHTGEGEAFFCFIFLDFWGGDVDWSCLHVLFEGGGTHHVSGPSF